MYIRIARQSSERGSALPEIPDLHEKLMGAILPLAPQNDPELAVAVPDFLRKSQLPFEIWVVYANDVAQYLFECGHIEECDIIVENNWLFVWFPKDMCDVLEKKNFN